MLHTCLHALASRNFCLCQHDGWQEDGGGKRCHFCLLISSSKISPLQQFEIGSALFIFCLEISGTERLAIVYMDGMDCKIKDWMGRYMYTNWDLLLIQKFVLQIVILVNVWYAQYTEPCVFVNEYWNSQLNSRWRILIPSKAGNVQALSFITLNSKANLTLLCCKHHHIYTSQ